MVFQDGHQYVSSDREYRVPIVFDNLIPPKAMPVTIGVFVNPGHNRRGAAKGPWRSSNRSNEYDILSDQYAQVPDRRAPARGREELPYSPDPAMRAIGGASSGGICAFTVAWERPDAFRKVISHIGSFTNIRGGHVYPALVRKARRGRCASSCRTARTISTTRSATGRSRTSRWRRR